MTDQTQVPCKGCGKTMAVPSGPVRAAVRRREPSVHFCSPICEKVFIATEGTRRQEELERAVLSNSGQ